MFQPIIPSKDFHKVPESNFYWKCSNGGLFTSAYNPDLSIRYRIYKAVLMLAAISYLALVLVILYIIVLDDE